MRLHIGKNHDAERNSPVESVFRLAGRGEDALTFGLGYLLAHDPAFCAKVIRACGISVPRGFTAGYAVHLQEVTRPGYGRRDIVIEGGGLRVVLEAKVGGARPDPRQLLKYAEEQRVWDRFSKRAMVALTRGALPPDTREHVAAAISGLGVSFHHVQWQMILEVVLRHRPSSGTEVSRHLFREYARFIRRDYEMGYHDAEILVQDLNPENAEIYCEGRVYVTHTTDKKAPLYFAPYLTAQNKVPGISTISRVEDVRTLRLADTEDLFEGSTECRHERWREGLGMLRERAKRQGFLYGDAQILFLGCPVPLAGGRLTKRRFNDTNPEKQIPSQIPKGFSLRFDQLLGAAAKMSG